jgi:hypothetical protein
MARLVACYPKYSPWENPYLPMALEPDSSHSSRPIPELVFNMCSTCRWHLILLQLRFYRLADSLLLKLMPCVTIA